MAGALQENYVHLWHIAEFFLQWQIFQINIMANQLDATTMAAGSV
jgi:hypothetical protein